jgi:hypothetical protein
MPGLEHAVSERTKRTDADPYGCKDGKRTDGYYAKNGLSFHHAKTTDGSNIAAYKMLWIDDVMSTECRYDMSLSDKRCAGCKHAGSGEAYSEMIRRNGK